MARITRREFLKGASAAITSLTLGVSGCNKLYKDVNYSQLSEDPLNGINLGDNIGKVMLDIENKYKDVPRKAYETLERILNKSEDIPRNFSSVMTLSSIHGMLKSDFGYRYNSFGSLAQVLNSYDQDLNVMYADCDTSTSIYLAIAEHLDLPIHAVNVPGHQFARWSGDRFYTNFETTTGKFVPDENFIAEFNIPEISVSHRTYLSDLTRDEVLGIPLRMLGDWFDIMKLDKACLQLLNKSLELDNKNPETYNSLRLHYDRIGEHKKTSQYRETVLELDPLFYSRKKSL